jgi:hypothetical protein
MYVCMYCQQLFDGNSLSVSGPNLELLFAYFGFAIGRKRRLNAS